MQSAALARTKYIIFLFVIYLIGSHLRISIYSGGKILVPMFLMLASGIAAVVLMRNRFVSEAGVPLLILAVLLLVQPMLSPPDGGDISSTYRSRIQLLVAASCALGMIYCLRDVAREHLFKTALVLWLFLLALALLEFFALREAFGSIRDLLYGSSGRFVYREDERDMELYGQLRPTALASEPSYLGDTLASLTTIVYLSGSAGLRRRIQIAAVMFVISYIAAPSLKISFYVLALSAWICLPLLVRRFGAGMTAAVIGITIVVAITFGGWVLQSDLLAARSSTGSFFGRLIVGVFVAADALQDYPILGLGVGNTEKAYGYIAGAWESTGAFDLFPWYRDLQATDLLSNGFWWMIIFLGVVGFAAFVAVLLVIMRIYGLFYASLALFCTWIIWYAGSAFVDPQSWFIFMIYSVGAWYEVETKFRERDV